MRCNRAQAMLDRYVAEELPLLERVALESHLRECPGCRQQLAQVQTLLGILRNVPAPPVPQGLVGRVMAKAGQEIGSQGSVVQTNLRPVPWWRHGVTPQQIGFAAALAAGLLVGVVLGRQTWTHSLRTSAPEPPIAHAQVMDAENVYLLDYLDYFSSTPRGSFPEIYLSLTSVDSNQEF